MKQKRVTLLSLLLVLCFLCACTPTRPEPSAPDPQPDPTTPVVTQGALVLPYLLDQTWDPILCSDGLQQDLSVLVYEGLFYLDESTTPQKKLCASYEVSEDFCTYTFTLRPEVSFSDGSPLTVQDAAATLNRALKSRRYRSRLAAIRNIHVSNDQKLVITLSSPNSDLPALLDIPLTKAGTEGALVPLGTGPYVPDLEEKSQLTGNPYWWQGQPRQKAISLMGIRNQNHQLNLFTSHQVQLLTMDILSEQTVHLSGSFTSKEVDTLRFCYLGFNLSGIFQRTELRSMVAQGINRNQLVTAYLSGHAVEAQFPFSPLSVNYPNYLEHPYSFSTYLQTLQESTLASREPTLLYLIVNQESHLQLTTAQHIAEALSRENLTVTVRALPWDAYVAALQQGQYDLYLAEARLTADYDLRPLLGSRGALNYSHYYDAELESLLRRYMTVPVAQKKQITEEICSFLRENTPLVPLFFERRTLLMQNEAASDLSPGFASPYAGLSVPAANTEN